MSSDDPPTDAPKENGKPVNPAPKQSRSIFSVPAPLKRIFDRFPLIVYAENEAPLRAPRRRDGHVLHVFATEDDARKGRPSFNPACLKWQVGQYTIQAAGAKWLIKCICIDVFEDRGCGIHARVLHQPRFTFRRPPIPPPIQSRSEGYHVCACTKQSIEEVACFAELGNESGRSLRPFGMMHFMSLVDSGIRNAWVCPTPKQSDGK